MCCFRISLFVIQIKGRQCRKQLLRLSRRMSLVRVQLPSGIVQLAERRYVCFWISPPIFQKIMRVLQNHSYFDWSELCCYGEGSAGSSPAGLCSISSRSILYIFMAAVQKTGSSCCRFESGFSFRE